MDGFLIKELADMIKKLSAEGKTVIMISHEIPLVFKTVDEAIILNQGEKMCIRDRGCTLFCSYHVLNDTGICNINPSVYAC